MKKEWPLPLSNILVLLLVFTGLYIGSLHSFLLFHSLVELFTIAVAGSIFLLVWNARGIMQNNYFLFLGISYLFVSVLGLLHILSYEGMGVFQGEQSNMATQFWVSARYIEACSLFAAPMFFNRKINPSWLIVFFCSLTAIFIWMIFSGLFPSCYVAGKGITVFKKISEYFIFFILLCSLAMIYGKRRFFDINLLILLSAAIFFTAMAELCFTAYSSVYGKINIIGHLFRFVSFYLIYKVVIVTGLRKPYELLFVGLKKNEEMLRKSEQEFRAIFELSAVGMVQSDSDTNRFVRVNDRFCRITGYTADELLEMSFIDITYPDDRHRDRERVERVLRGEAETWISEKRYIRKDGIVIWVKVTGTSFHSPLNQSRRTTAIIVDITERKNAEQALRESENKYRLLFENMQNGFAYYKIITDEDKRPIDHVFLEVNSPFAKKIGLPREEIIGKRVTEVLPDIRNDDFDWIGILGKVALTGEAINFDQYTSMFGKWLSIAAYSPERGYFAIIIRDITLRKHAEARLRRSEWQFKGAFDNAAVGFAQVSLEGRWLDVNSKLCDIFGYSRKELLQKSRQDITHIEDLDEYKNLAARLAEGKIDYYTMEIRCFHKDGHIVWTNLTSSLQRDDEKYPLYFINVVQDITERKAIEQALKESEEKFRLLASSIKDVIWMSTPGVTKMIYVNPAYKEVWGRTCESLFEDPHSFAEAIHPDDMGLMADAFTQHAAGNWQRHYRIIRPDGSVRWIEDEGSPIYDETGNITLMAGVARDITDRKLAEQAREKHLMRLNVLLHISTSVLSARSTQDMLQKIVDAAVQLTDASSGISVHGFHDNAFKIGAVSPIVPNMDSSLETIFFIKKGGVYQELLEKNRSVRLTDEELRNHPRWQGLPEGHRPISGLLGVSLIGWDKESKGMIMVTGKKEGDFSFEDQILLRQLGSLCSLGLLHIEAREQAEQKAHEAEEGRKQLIELTKELERSNKDLQHFAYIASHDLQEPLRTIGGFLQLLRRRYEGKLDEKADTFINHAVEGATYMQKLLSDLLAYSRVGGGALQQQMLPLKNCVDQAMQNLHTAIDETGAVITCGDLPTVWVDEMQMVQLMQNLIGNAIKFRGQEKPDIQISSERKGHEWVICIRDNGIGIDPKQNERIFLMFQRLHRRGEYPGTGIGLSVCKKIVERHNGRMWVEPAPVKGSSFYISLPAEGESSSTN